MIEKLNGSRIVTSNSNLFSPREKARISEQHISISRGYGKSEESTLKHLNFIVAVFIQWISMGCKP
jgi:hypothetical protein